MIRFTLIRILWLIPVIIAVSFIVFSLMELAPGSIVDSARSEDMTEESRQELIVRFNLDKPMIYRYGVYMINLAQGDLGVSDHTGASVWGTFIQRLPNTLILSVSALIIGSLISIPLGIIAAKRAGTLVDNSITVLSLFGISMPLFWLGSLLLILFAANLRLLPAGGFDDGIRSLILPALCSSFALLANATRQTRSNMLEVLNADYLRTARAKGVPESVVIRKHALRNAWIPIITAIGISLSIQLAGSVVIESVFAWPGIGRMAAEAVRARDVTTTTGVVIMTTILYVLIQLIADLLYAFVDPRIKAQYTGKKRKRRKTALNIKMPANGMSKRGTPGESGMIPCATGNERETAKFVPQVSFVAVTADMGKDAEAPSDTYYVPTTPVNNVIESTFVTRERFEHHAEDVSAPYTDADSMHATNKKTGAFITRKNKKRNRIGEIFHSLRRNKGAMAGLIILALLFVTFIGSLFISWESITAISRELRFHPPSLQYPFGGDGFGRNNFLRIIYGARYTLAIGFGAVSISTFLGVTLGAFAGYYGSIVDDVIMRLSDVLASIPGILLGMVIVTVLGQSIQNLIIAVGVQATPIFVRMTRASVMTVRNHEYVEASKAVGLSNFRILFTQVLPNGLSPVIVTVTASMGIAIIVASSLSYLQFGVPVPHPEWGALISDAKEFVRRAPYLTTIPGLYIMITVLGFNLLGDGLRDALDPKLKKR